MNQLFDLTADGPRRLYHSGMTDTIVPHQLCDSDASDVMVVPQVEKTAATGGCADLVWIHPMKYDKKDGHLKADGTRLKWGPIPENIALGHHRANVVFLWKGCIDRYRVVM